MGGKPVTVSVQGEEVEVVTLEKGAQDLAVLATDAAGDPLCLAPVQGVPPDIYDLAAVLTIEGFEAVVDGPELRVWR